MIDYDNIEYVEFETLKGKTFSKVVSEESDSINFYSKEYLYVLKHLQDCCENVYIDSIVGDLEDMENTPILLAEESSNSRETHDGSETWTFYKLASIKGYVDIRFHGESNGYYSESVSLVRYKIKGQNENLGS